jgi:hypothetical protein
MTAATATAAETAAAAKRVTRAFKPSSPIGKRLEYLLSLEVQAAVLKAQIDAEKGYLLKHCHRYGLDTLKLENRLTCSAASKSSWIYTPGTLALAQQLKARQQAEQTNGKAERVPGAPYLSVRVQKGAAIAPQPEHDLAAFGAEVQAAAASAAN